MDTADAGDTLGAWAPVGADVADSLPPRRLRFPGEAEDLDEPVDYELVERLGVGGMGEVWRARQPAVGHGVAVKLPKRADDPTALPRFAAEARITRWLQHPGVVSVLELARVHGRQGDGRVFYAMPENVGAVWREKLRTNTQTQNLDILQHLADTLAHAHARGIIHRDLKPDNVLLGEHGEVLLGDWGVAASLSNGGDGDHGDNEAGAGVAPGLSPKNAFAGTPRYMAPEQAAADWQRIGAATDVYLLGAVLLEILTGQPPHADAGETVATLHHAIRNDPPTLRDRSRLGQVVRKALATRPTERYADASTFAAALREARQPLRGSRAARQALRGVGMLARIALVVVLLLFAARLVAVYINDQLTVGEMVEGLWGIVKEKTRATRSAILGPPADPTAHWPNDYTALMEKYGRRGKLMASASSGGWVKDSAGFSRVEPEAREVLEAWEKVGDLRREDYLQRLRPFRPDEAVLSYFLSDTWEGKAKHVHEPEATRRRMASHYAQRPPTTVWYVEFLNPPAKASTDTYVMAVAVYFGASGGHGRREVEITLVREDMTYRVDWDRLIDRYFNDPAL